MKNLVIIPAYNEEENIRKVIDDINRNAKEFDYIIINDCSKDKTREICEQMGFNHINLPINLGIGGAVQTGYKYALENGYEYAVQIDGDGQHDPMYLGKMLDKIKKKNVDMVIGSRFIEKEGFQSSTIRRVGIKYFSFLIKLFTGATVTDPTSGLRLVNRKCIEKFAMCYPKDYPEPESIVTLLKLNMKGCEIPVVMRERTGGVSSISPVKSIYYMIKVSIAIFMEKIR